MLAITVRVDVRDSVSFIAFASAVAGTLVRTMDSDRPAVTAALNTRFLSI